MAGRREAAMRAAPQKLPARQQCAVVHALLCHPGCGRIGAQRRLAHQMRAAGAGIGGNGLRLVHANTVRVRMSVAKWKRFRGREKGRCRESSGLWFVGATSPDYIRATALLLSSDRHNLIFRRVRSRNRQFFGLYPIRVTVPIYRNGFICVKFTAREIFIY